MNAHKPLTIAAIADLHINDMSQGKYDWLYEMIAKEAQVLLVGGDFTVEGLAEEAELFATDIIKILSIPIVVVLGNHDVQNKKENEIKKILKSKGIHVLDGESVIIENIGFTGIKGFCGGFNQYMLASWGEESIKQFVYETIQEALKLENALDRLETEKKIVLMHYSPIKQTVIGEPEEIMPFLGSSRLADSINRKQVTAVFHGHAHHGTVSGKTSKNIPVFNTAFPLLQKTYPKKPFVSFTI